MKELTILGIDGVGKSTILNTIQNDSIVDDFHLVSSPNFHEVDKRNSYNQLSQVLSQYSHHCDITGNVASKSLAMFFQVSLFSKYVQNATEVLSFRNPIIDLLVYGDLYLKYLPSDFKVDDFWQDIDQQQAPLLKQYILVKLKDWSINTDELNQLLIKIKDIFSYPFKKAIAELETLFELKLPQNAIYLELDLNEAKRRMDQRGATREFHEQLPQMEYLDQRYKFVLESFKSEIAEFNYEVYSLNHGFKLEEFKNIIYNLLKR